MIHPKKKSSFIAVLFANPFVRSKNENKNNFTEVTIQKARYNGCEVYCAINRAKVEQIMLSSLVKAPVVVHVPCPVLF